MIVRYDFDNLTDLADKVVKRWPTISDVINTFYDHLAEALENINRDRSDDLRIVDDKEFQHEFYNNFLEAMLELQPK